MSIPSTATPSHTHQATGRPPVILLMGPTASGKTDLAVELVKRLPCDIVSVDSVMIYRGMDIGSAKPDANILAQAPHRLIDICDPAEVFSAEQFRLRAQAEIQDILERGRVPLLVGGSMLYFRALQQGLSPMPAADPVVRARLEVRAAAQGWPALHAELAQVDPVAAARIHANDPQRIQRALEVYELTGQPISTLQSATESPVQSWRWVKLALTPPNRELHRQQVAERFRAMLAQGLVAEVERLYQRGDLHPDLPAIRAVGYRQVWNYLAGAWDYETMVERGIIVTRQYAKRQMTWLRGESGLTTFPSTDVQLVTRALKYLAANAI